MNARFTKAIALAFAALLVTAGGAAALSTDTETTNSPEQSDLTDTSVLTQPHNSSVTQRIQITGDTATDTSTLTNPEEAFTLRMVVNDSASSQDGEVLYETTETWGVTTVGSAPDHYYLNVSNPSWGDELEYGATENVSIDARVIFNATESDESVTNITFTAAPEGENARIEVTNAERTLANNSVSGFSLSSLAVWGSSSDAEPGAAQVSDKTNVSNNTEKVIIDLDNSSTTSSFSAVTDGVSAGDFTTLSYGTLNNTAVPVFVASADVPWFDTSSNTYAVINNNGGKLTIHNVNATANAGALDVSATGNEGLGFWKTRKLLSSYDVGAYTTFTVAGSTIDYNGQPEGIEDIKVEA